MITEDANQVYRFDLSTSNPPDAFDVATGAYGLVLSPDDSVYYLISNSDYQVYGYDAVTGNQLVLQSKYGYQVPYQLEPPPTVPRFTPPTAVRAIRAFAS